jgi:hypothetical protein
MAACCVHWVNWPSESGILNYNIPGGGKQTSMLTYLSKVLLQPIVLVDHLLSAILHVVVILRGYGHKMNRPEIKAVEHPVIIVSRHSETRLQTFFLSRSKLKYNNETVEQKISST